MHIANVRYDSAKKNNVYRGNYSVSIVVFVSLGSWLLHSVSGLFVCVARFGLVQSIASGQFGPGGSMQED